MSRMLKVPPLFALLTFAACTPDHQIQREVYRDTFYQEPPALVDILWVVDDSPSMNQEQAEVANRFSGFIGHLEETNIDFHIGVITTDMDPENPDRARLLGDPQVLSAEVPDYEARFAERVQVGVDGSDMERGLEAALQAVTEPMASDANAGFLRTDAVLSVIFVSDENDCSDRGALPAGSNGTDCYDQADQLVSIRQFVNEFRALKAEPSMVIASAVVGPEVVEFCEDTVPGTRYLALASNLGGLQANICEHDYTSIMDELGLSVSGVRTSFQLSYAPVMETLTLYSGEGEDESTWEVVPEDAENGWTYDDGTRYVVFHGDAIPSRGAVVTAEYEIAG